PNVPYQDRHRRCIRCHTGFRSFLEAGSFRSFGEEVVVLEDPFEHNETRNFEVQANATNIGLDVRKVATIDPSSYAEPLSKEHILSIEFEFDSFDIPDSAFEWLGHVYSFIQHNPQTSVKVIGHTDNIGSMDYNLKLSEKRSQAVAKYLQQMGLEESSILIRYRGEAQPIHSNNTSLGRTRNRRVEFIFDYRGEGQTQNILPTTMANKP
ncbi:MAG: OmpA family protein, partial [Cyclobacteriaceae bacterium]